MIQSNRLEEVLRLIPLIKRLDPAYTYHHNDLGVIYMLKDQKDHSLNALKKNLSYNEGSYVGLSWAYLYFGEVEHAANLLESGFSKSELRPPLYLAYLAYAYEQLGHKEKRRKIIEELMTKKSKGDKEVSYALAFYYSGIGEKETALNWLENAYQNHDVELLWVNVDPQFRILRDNKKFQGLVKRIGFNEVEKTH